MSPTELAKRLRQRRKHEELLQTCVGRLDIVNIVLAIYLRGMNQVPRDPGLRRTSWVKTLGFTLLLHQQDLVSVAELDASISICSLTKRNNLILFVLRASCRLCDITISIVQSPNSLCMPHISKNFFGIRSSSMLVTLLSFSEICVTKRGRRCSWSRLPWEGASVLFDIHKKSGGQVNHRV